MGTIEITQVEYHRNGVAGEGFYAIRFTDPDEGAMLAVVFPQYKDDGYEELDYGGNPRVAVFKEALLPDVTFGVNSWRGDHYAGPLYDAIKQRHGGA